MKLILSTILLTSAIYAQKPRTFTPEMRLYNHGKVILGREYKTRYFECRDIFNEQQLRIEALADSIAARNARNRELESINRGLYDEAEKLQYDLGRLRERNAWYNSKWLYLGLGFVGGAWIASEIKN